MAATLIVPAIAWACAPSTGQIAFNQSSYNSGAAVKVIGSGFAKNAPVVLKMQSPSGAPQTVAPSTTTNDTGYFEASFRLPSDAAAGTYALQAVTNPSGEGHGGQTVPTAATSTFTVVAAAAPPPAAPPAAATAPAAAPPIAATQAPSSAPSIAAATSPLAIRGITARVSPARDRRAPHRYVISGAILRPAGVGTSACKGGRVSAQFKTRAGKTISTRRDTLSSTSCSYRITVTFQNRRRLGSGRLKVRVRFLGSDRLLPRAAITRTMRAG